MRVKTPKNEIFQKVSMRLFMIHSITFKANLESAIIFLHAFDDFLSQLSDFKLSTANPTV
jgi:hypothetical protein